MTSSGHSGETAAWAPVIHGRTYYVDEWWRALPEGVTRDGEVGGVVNGAVADGRVPVPRFVLARLSAGTLVGVVCLPSRIGTRMVADSHGRPLYCFVGWYCDDPRAIVPSLAELAESWKRLVLPEYEQALLPVWRASSQQVRIPAVSKPRPAPWAVPGGQRLPEPPGFMAGFNVRENIVQVYPSARAALVWQTVADHGARAALATGWPTYRSAIHASLTHVCADDFNEPSPLAERVPPREDRRATGSSQGQRARSGYQPAMTVGARPPDRHGWAGRDETWPGSHQEGSDPGGGLLGGLKRAVSGILPGGDTGLPREPPGHRGAWTFRPPSSFEAAEGPFVFWYTIGDRAICCADRRTGQRAEWTGSHWVAAAPGMTDQPQTQPRTPGHHTAPAGPGARHQDPPDRVSAPRLGTVAPQPPPPDARQKLNSTFSAFGRSARDQEGSSGAAEVPGAQGAEGQESGTRPEDASSGADSPPETGQTASP